MPILYLTNFMGLVDGEQVSREKSAISFFKQVKDHAKVDYSDMILFDDEAVNNDITHELGITFQILKYKDGLTWGDYQRGIDMWQRAKSIRSPYKGQILSHYPLALPIGYAAVDEGTLHLLEKGESWVDTNDSARWGYGMYLTDNPAM
ncbi:hypothetical protein CONPUDRAFT_160682 [Coniophora puteana RWD-64-598 SS2]|uniref:Uncharacterized protein n=1 Tax=Coniophora puteana (strain RWD-64-598) TaxID=741705 RepID=R7SD84_CONPW|nr:uncharacterized protein CONPUDRAFT_160682 [Coniophora puteana RWD-64-598 SS2]EIW73820.1 hypothetical protein CONPUDRAFT_160682 [Coniophora puteana RWD-64-598 SS2]